MNSKRNSNCALPSATGASNNKQTPTKTTSDINTAQQQQSAGRDKSSSQPETTQSGVCVNFMSKFRDKDTRVLKNLNSTQFIEVWNNYDKDGK